MKKFKDLLKKMVLTKTPNITADMFGEVQPSRPYPLDRNDGLNIRLNKVDNGWVVNATTEDKQGNYVIQTRVCLDGTDVMDEVHAVVSMFKIK